MYEIAIVGLGPAGIFALASLPIHILQTTIVFEESNVCGDLAKYGGIRANITKQEILTAFKKIPRWSEKTANYFTKYGDEDCPFLSDVCKQLREWILPDLGAVNYRTKRMDQLSQSANGWMLKSNDELFEAKKVLFCIGSKPKTLDLPKATLPLNQCLCKADLERHVSKEDRVVVIGTAHSGTLILKNLYELGQKDVVAIYKETPFLFARNGVLGGLKQESAKIADEIIKKTWGDLCPVLISCNDISKTFRALEKATLVLYSFGYEKPVFTYTDKNSIIQIANYNELTNRFANMTNIWGFGIAFPSYKPGTHFHDIGFNGFITAIQNSITDILQE